MLFLELLFYMKMDFPQEVAVCFDPQDNWYFQKKQVNLIPNTTKLLSAPGSMGTRVPQRTLCPCSMCPSDGISPTQVFIAPVLEAAALPQPHAQAGWCVCPRVSLRAWSRRAVGHSPPVGPYSPPQRSLAATREDLAFWKEHYTTLKAELTKMTTTHTELENSFHVLQSELQVH